MSIKRKLILIVLVFSTLIIVLMGLNYFVMSTLSTVRAFVAGEAFYSKGQKDATYFLARYTTTLREEEYQLFLENVKIPVGDRIAREELLKEDTDYSIVDAELIQLAISFNKMTESLERAISERDLANEKLEVRAKQLSEAQELAHVGSWELDVETNMMTATEEFYRIFGLDPATPFTAEELMRMVHPADFEQVLNQMDNTLANHDLFFLDFKIIRQDGEVREVSQRGRPVINEKGKIIKIIGTTQDITERFKIQMQMIQSNKMASLGEMASGIAHEINNPLAIIKMAALQMQRNITTDNTALRNGVSKIDTTVDRISKIIQGLRTFSRDGRNDPFELVSFDKMIEDILSFCNERLKHHSILLIKDDLNPNLVFEGRQIEISQVLLNLLNNAIDAVDSADVTEKWIKISAINDGDYLEIKVSDSGPNIPKETQSKMFQPFFTTKEIGKGTGLGLSLSLTIVKNHLGELYLDKESPSTCFVLRLPNKQA